MIPPNGRGSKPQIVAEFNYRDEERRLLFQAVRREPGADGARKDFRQRRPDDRGDWIWNLGGVRRVLYRLPELLAADSEIPVFIPEGEKCVERLRELGLVATCNPMGAGKWESEYSESLRGRNVVILPDNDDAGHKHAEQVLQSLRGIAIDPFILTLPGLPEKGDVYDWLAVEGNTKEKLLELAYQAAAAAQRLEEEKREPANSPARSGSTALEIILEYFREVYQPVFRRGTAIYSGALRREVKAGEATFGAGQVLIDKLMSAVDAAKDTNGGDVDRRKLPQLFRAWASSAWVDLIAALPEESEAVEIDPQAREEFRAAVKAALLTHVLLGKEFEDGKETHSQNRPLIDWAYQFATPGQWGTVRGYRLWMRKDPDCPVRVALRAELFSQVGRTHLARYSHADFARLAELYDVGTRSRAGGQRMVELSQSFLAEFRAGASVDELTGLDPPAPTQAPSADTCNDTTSDEVDDLTGNLARARTREDSAQATARRSTS